MADVQQLLREFIARREAGEDVRPADVLDRVDGTDRRELAELLDAYLERAPRRRFDPAAFTRSPARPLADDLARSLQGRAGAWPVVLPRLRNRARLRRSELVARLAETLGVADRADKVGVYYHAMEQGELDPRGVSDRVLDALARLTGTTVAALREAAAELPRPAAPGAAGAPAFARTAEPAPEHLAAMQGTAAQPAREERDEVDELFTGGASDDPPS